jgi:hypothetical protein
LKPAEFTLCLVVGCALVMRPLLGFLPEVAAGEVAKYLLVLSVLAGCFLLVNRVVAGCCVAAAGRCVVAAAA